MFNDCGLYGMELESEKLNDAVTHKHTHTHTFTTIKLQSKTVKLKHTN